MKAVLIPATGGIAIVGLADLCEYTAAPDGGLDARASMYALQAALGCADIGGMQLTSHWCAWFPIRTHAAVNERATWLARSYGVLAPRRLHGPVVITGTGAQFGILASLRDGQIDAVCRRAAELSLKRH